MDKEVVLRNIDRIHTTKMGEERIHHNIEDDIVDVVLWCKNHILKKDCFIFKKGKNFYANIDGFVITINSYSFTIITVHKEKKN